MNRLIKKEQLAPNPQPAEITLLTEIRDLLVAKPHSHAAAVRRTG
jgi:hypothetical protein